ncbi:ST-I family heat-stable enterotoxin [Chitinophaga defluvii]|uniref:ST-I family heat-stable enterotoxin n=1 Tax=Chitinophaga defluvii TaxID=3163343 RepID=A0ABV2T8R8_9BACT
MEMLDRSWAYCCEFVCNPTKSNF